MLIINGIIKNEKKKLAMEMGELFRTEAYNLLLDCVHIAIFFLNSISLSLLFCELRNITQEIKYEMLSLSRVQNHFDTCM